MLKWPITYTDYNGVERTEDHYFQLNETQMIELELEIEGGLEALINRIVASKDIREIYHTFKKIIFAAYGEKSPDGRYHVKNDQVRAKFESSPAFNALIMGFLDDPAKAADFIQGIIPEPDEKTLKEVEKQRAELQAQFKGIAGGKAEESASDNGGTN